MGEVGGEPVDQWIKFTHLHEYTHQMKSHQIFIQLYIGNATPGPIMLNPRFIRGTFYHGHIHYQALSRGMRKQTICICKNTDVEADQRFRFATRIVQFLYFLTPKFPISSHCLFVQLGLCHTWSETTLFSFSHDAVH